MRLPRNRLACFLLGIATPLVPGLLLLAYSTQTLQRDKQEQKFPKQISGSQKSQYSMRQ